MKDNPHLIHIVMDNIIVLTINRPDKLNALSTEVFNILGDLVKKFRDDKRLRVMLLRSTGRFFSAGADMKEYSSEPSREGRTASEIREYLRYGHRNMQPILDEIEHLEKPVVVAHHAMCVGGGLELSLSCDFRLAAESAGYALPEGLFGILPASNGVSRLTRICGPHWARWLVMANQPVTAMEALNMGLVHKVFPDEDFEAGVMRFCKHLAAQNAEQMGAAKHTIEATYEVGRDTARHIERMACAALMLNPDSLALRDEYLKSVGAGLGRLG